jgi:hypothetical protein
MTHHVSNAHSPQQMRTMSNAGHVVEGAIISSAGVLLMRESLSREGASSVVANLLASAGALLGLGLVAGSFSHGGPRRFFSADHQQREHLQMAALVTCAGLVRRKGKVGTTLSDLATARIGQMFLTHEQHGSGEAAAEAKAKHERLGRTILGASASSLLGDVFGSRWFRLLGAAMLVASGVQLVLYREPTGAYEED